MILLTGATGSAGSFIANEFVRERVPVRILVRNRAKATGFEKVPTVEIVEGDMARSDSLGAALDGVDRVLMISAPLMDMVETQTAFIDAAKAAGVRHVIKFSGLDARPDSTFPFGLMHKEIEEYLDDGAFYLALGDVRLNPIDLVDVAKVAFLLLRDGGHEGARIAITGPEALTMAEIADRISRAIGKTVRYVAVSPAARRQALLAHGIQAEFADALDKQVKERLKGGIESQVDLSTHQLFNVKPTTFLEFAQRNAKAFGAAAAA
jgi:uncharacterized protein YbjT (DUF2867 family)